MHTGFSRVHTRFECCVHAAFSIPAKRLHGLDVALDGSHFFLAPTATHCDSLLFYSERAVQSVGLVGSRRVEWNEAMQAPLLIS